jgi:Tfp pilus assembly ATPase PilU
VVGCAIGSVWGVTGVAVGASVAIVAHFVTMLVFSARISRGLVGRVLRSYARSLPVAAATAAVAWPVAAALRGAVPDLVVVLGTAGSGVVAAVAALVASRRLFRDELAVLAAARSRTAPRAG